MTFDILFQYFRHLTCHLSVVFLNVLSYAISLFMSTVMSYVSDVMSIGYLHVISHFIKSINVNEHKNSYNCEFMDIIDFHSQLLVVSNNYRILRAL